MVNRRRQVFSIHHLPFTIYQNLPAAAGRGLKFFVNGEATAAHDKQRERHAEQRDGVLKAFRREECAPVDAEDSREHRAGDEESADARQQSEEDEQAADEFGDERCAHPEPRRAHEAEGRGGGKKLRPARPAPYPESLLQAMRGHDEAERETHRQRKPGGRRRNQILEHQKSPFRFWVESASADARRFRPRLVP